MGAVFFNRLANSIVNALSMETKSITFWTDSANVLWWIRGYSRAFKPFVANRVGEIQMSSSPEQWRHIPTTLNPADYLTRGVKPVEILNLKSWWEGPEYLRKDKSLWPNVIVEKEPFNALKEIKMRNNSRLDLGKTMLSRCVEMSVNLTQRKNIDLHKCTIGLHMMHICMTICATYAFCSKYVVQVKW